MNSICRASSLYTKYRWQPVSVIVSSISCCVQYNIWSSTENMEPCCLKETLKIFMHIVQFLCGRLRILSLST